MIPILFFLVGQVVNLQADCQSAPNPEPAIRSLLDTPRWITYTVTKPDGGPIHIYYRVQDGGIAAVRPVNPDHDHFETRGLPVHCLSNVDPEQSVRYLATLAPATKGALAALALHATPAADTVLDKLVEPGQPESTRKEATTWLGIARGKHGVDKLLKLAREDASSKVRGQALFWLAQKAGRQIAEGAIADSIANDPDTHVKRTAVFALSQLPNHEGVPRLIDVARTNRNLEVRKQALFWLGQSKDPRALQFIEEILTR